MIVHLPDTQWIEYLGHAYRQIISAIPLPFSELVPSSIPEAPGVYIITAKIEEKQVPYYVGRTKNLRQRIYNNHLMGPLSNARLKKYLIDNGECNSIAEAKMFIKSYCWVRWIEVEDIRPRGAIEGYITGMIFPKYGIYEEH